MSVRASKDDQASKASSRARGSSRSPASQVKASQANQVKVSQVKASQANQVKVSWVKSSRVRASQARASSAVQVSRARRVRAHGRPARALAHPGPAHRARVVRVRARGLATIRSVRRRPAWARRPPSGLVKDRAARLRPVAGKGRGKATVMARVAQAARGRLVRVPARGQVGLTRPGPVVRVPAVPAPAR